MPLSWPDELLPWSGVLADLARQPELLALAGRGAVVPIERLTPDSRAAVRAFLRGQGQTYQRETDGLVLRTEDTTAPGVLGTTALSRLLHIEVQRGNKVVAQAALVMDRREVPAPVSGRK